MARPGGRSSMARTVLRRARGTVRKLAGRLGPKENPPTLVVSFTTPEEFAAFIADPRARRTYAVLEVKVDPWFAIRPDWAGRVGPLPGIRTCRTDFDHDGKRASARIELATAESGYELVRAAFGVFYPVRRTTGFGGQRIAVLPDAPADLRWHLGGGMRPTPPHKAPKQRFTEFDVRLAATEDQVIRDPGGPAIVVTRPAAPPVLVDPKVHRPLERPQPSATSRSATAAFRGERLIISSGKHVILDRPAATPVTATDLRRLTGVTDMDVSALGSGHLATHRVAELATYGAVLHDAAGGLELDPTLARLVQEPFLADGLLNHMNRSLAQVRSVMRGHARAFRTDDLPSISVILSCQRGTLLERILEQMAAQDHPRVEIVVGCHGFPAPPRESFSPAVQARLGPVLEFGPDAIFGDVLASLSAAASGDFLSKVDDDDFYGPSHLGDLYTAWVYSEAQLVGKKLALVHFDATDTLAVRSLFLEGYRWQVAGGASMIAKADLAALGGWRSQVRAVDRGLYTRLEDAGGVNYACSGPGYVHTRHAQGHTWTVSDRYFLENHTTEVLDGIPPAALGIRPAPDFPA